jgi:hypothetical protein
MLIHTFGDLHKVNNVYSEKKLIGTCDYYLYNWFFNYLKRVYKSEFSYLMSLDRLNLIFWIESDKADTSNFLSNTWMYVTEMLSYFKNKNVDEYFKKLMEKYYQNPTIPENWRSLYLLIDNAVEGNVEDINEDDFDKALDKININAINENKELKDKVASLKIELDLIKQDNISKSVIEEESKDTTQEKTRVIEEYSIIELFKLIIRKIILFFKK